MNRTDFMSAIQIRPYAGEDSSAIQWLAFASNAFNVMVPFYTNVDEVPEYLANTSAEVSTNNFYWTSRMIAAMADASYAKSVFHIERYDEKVMSKAHEIIYRYDDLLGADRDVQTDAVSKLGQKLRQQATRESADMVRQAASDTLGKVLYELSNQMKNSYSRSDA